MFREHITCHGCCVSVTDAFEKKKHFIFEVSRQSSSPKFSMNCPNIFKERKLLSLISNYTPMASYDHEL